MSSIVSIGTAVPKHAYNQTLLAEYMSQHLKLEAGESRKLKALYNNTAITKRHSVLPDFNNETEKMLFDIIGCEDAPSLEQRMEIFNKEAFPLAKKAIDDCFERAGNKIVLNDLTHIITVSCTGFTAPGLEIEIIEKLNLKPETSRFAVNFIGCYAAFPALKMADAICKTDDNAKVLIVCVELCTIHFQRETDNDNLLANSLFSDGAAAVLVTSDDVAKNYSRSLKMDAFGSCVLHKGNSDMAWRLSSKGFLMTLSSYVPQLVDEGIMPLVTQILGNLKIKKEDIHHWALHPGGKRILDVCSRVLNFEREQLLPSFKILSEYGNMSAATVLFVLKEMWENNIDWNKKEKIFAAGFGPGLSLESAVLTTSSN